MNLSSVRVAGQVILSLFYAKSKQSIKMSKVLGIHKSSTGLPTAFVPKPHSLHPMSPLWSFKHQGIQGPEIRNIRTILFRVSLGDYRRKTYITSTHARKSMKFHQGQN